MPTTARETRSQKRHTRPDDSESTKQLLTTRSQPKRRKRTPDDVNSNAQILQFGKATKAWKSPPRPVKNSAATKKNDGVDRLTTLPQELLNKISMELFSDPACPPSTIFVLSRTSHKLFDAGIEALYRVPRLHTSAHAFRLLDTLEHHPSYQPKIHTLTLPVNPLLKYVTPGLGSFDIAKLLRLTPNLEELEIIREMGAGPKERREAKVQWKYPKTLFDALEGIHDEEKVCEPIRLKRWRWDGDWMQGYTVGMLLEIHRTSLRSLTHLACSNIDVLYETDKVTASDLEFGTLIANLPNLKSLEIIRSSLATDAFFESLPSVAPNLRLTTLRLIRNREVSTGLSALLNSPLCQQLKHLHILHCPSINLHFMSVLGNTKELRTLVYDGLYFAESIGDDTQPCFTDLLPLDPEWPTTLEFISFSSLRKGTAPQAEQLIGSLIDRAYCGQLKRLRTVKLHIILGQMEWRARAVFRQNWETKFLDAFTRKESRPLRYSSRSRASSSEDSVCGGGCEEQNVELRLDCIRPGTDQFTEDDFVDPDDGRVGRRWSPKTIRVGARRGAKVTAKGKGVAKGAAKGRRKGVVEAGSSTGVKTTVARRRVQPIATYADPESDTDYKDDNDDDEDYQD